MKITIEVPYNCCVSKWYVPYKYCFYSDNKKYVIFLLWPFFALKELFNNVFIYIILKYLKFNRAIKRAIKHDFINRVIKSIKEVEDDILEEINIRPNKPNVGKVGCLRRIQKLRSDLEELK